MFNQIFLDPKLFGHGFFWTQQMRTLNFLDPECLALKEVFLVKSRCPTLDNPPPPWAPRLELFVFIHFVLDLNKEGNPCLQKYFIKDCGLDLIWQAWRLFKSCWVEIKRVTGCLSLTQILHHYHTTHSDLTNNPECTTNIKYI